jgi:hypothetical protein
MRLSRMISSFLACLAAAKSVGDIRSPPMQPVASNIAAITARLPDRWKAQPAP